MTETQYTVVEWSPDKVRAYDPVARQLVTEATVSDALRRVGKPVAVGLCLSRRVSFVREARTPDVDREQARSILQLRVEDMFPATDDGVCFDFTVGSHRYDDGRLTTVAAVGSETLRAAIKDVNDAGAKVAWTAPVALGSVTASRDHASDSVALVESDGEFLNIDVVRHGSLVFSRSVLDPTDAKGRSTEVARTLAAAGVSGAMTAAVKGIELSSDAVSIDSGALVAMSQHDAGTYNVLTPEAQARIARAGSASKSRLALLMWAAVVCVGALAYFERTDAIAEIEANEIKVGAKRNRAEGALDAATKAVTSDETKMNRIAMAFSPTQTPSDVLTVVSNAVPVGAWLNGITYERGKEIQIRGTATRSDAVSEFTAGLAQDTRFRDVKLVFANNAEIEATAVVQFAVTARVVGNLPLEDKDIKRKSS